MRNIEDVTNDIDEANRQARRDTVAQLKQQVTIVETDTDGKVHEYDGGLRTRADLEREVFRQGGKRVLPDVYRVTWRRGLTVEYWIG